MTVNGNGTYTTPTGTRADQRHRDGTYQWNATYSGDTNNSSASDNGNTNEQVVVGPAPTAITTTPNPTSVTLGTSPVTLLDSANLTGVDDPTGTITFTLYLGSSKVDTETVLVNGNGPYTTHTGYTVPTSGNVLGTYQWNATYSGDANNDKVSDNDNPNEQVSVLPPAFVINTSDSPDFIGSLPWFIDQANQSASSAPFTIDFRIPGPGPFVITTGTPLPKITHRVFIDGTSQPGYSAGYPVIQINGNNAVEDGLTLANGSSGSTILGLDIYGFISNGSTGTGGAGIHILSDNNTIAQDFIGTDVTGTKTGLGDGALPGNAVGILIDSSFGNSIGAAGAPVNVISGNVVGIEFMQSNSASSGGSNTVINNYIGIGKDQNGLGNFIGVWVDGVPGTQIGLPGAGNANYISDNSEAGVYIYQSGAFGTRVQGNIIGLGPAGETYPHKANPDPLFPDPVGVYIQDSSSNMIGGGGQGEDNTISGNNVGVYIFQTALGLSVNNQILGNFIGYGTAGIATNPGNRSYGILLYNAPINYPPSSNQARQANHIVDSGKPFLNYSGPVSMTSQSSTTQGSSTGSDSVPRNSPRHSKITPHPSPRSSASQKRVAVHGRPVPAGPIRKTRARVRH